jgi:membrane-bound ClpP family serine protease
MMRFRNKKKAIQRLYIGGILLLFIAFVLIVKNVFTVGFIFIFIGILMMIPNYWIFYIKESESNERWTLYWFVQFLALPLTLIICIIFFINKLFN